MEEILMPASRRSMLAAAGAGVALSGIAKATGGSAFAQDGSVTEKEVADLIRLSAESNAALMRGDIDRYRALITLTDDFTLMSPFGGRPTRGSAMTDERWEAMRQFFRNGTLEQELVQSYASRDMVVLVINEHGSGEVGGLPAQEWRLRVTLVYRREGRDWRLAHRHADPLVKGVSLNQAAALARGEAP